MPKIRVDGYEFFFYSNEGNEDPHYHVYIDGHELKFWLDSGIVATKNPRIGEHKINRVAKVIRKNKNMLRGFWNDYQSRR